MKKANFLGSWPNSFFISSQPININTNAMLTLYEVKEMNYTVYIGSRGNKFIFNVAYSNEPAPTGGYPSLRYILRVKGIWDTSPIIKRAEEIMGRTHAENVAIGESEMGRKLE